MHLQLLWALLFTILSSSLSARPAPSSVKYERYRLNADGYTMILTEHIPEYRPIYQTIRIVDENNDTVAMFRHCVAMTAHDEATMMEAISCASESSSAEVLIQYGAAQLVVGVWDDGSSTRKFSKDKS